MGLLSSVLFTTESLADSRSTRNPYSVFSSVNSKRKWSENVEKSIRGIFFFSGYLGKPKFGENTTEKDPRAQDNKKKFFGATKSILVLSPNHTTTMNHPHTVTHTVTHPHTHTQ